MILERVAGEGLERKGRECPWGEENGDTGKLAGHLAVWQGAQGLGLGGDEVESWRKPGSGEQYGLDVGGYKSHRGRHTVF